jgi:hypothetical protein
MTATNIWGPSITVPTSHAMHEKFAFAAMIRRA